MRITPTLARRHVALDIETISLDPADQKGALSALTGRIVCIGLLIDDGATVQETALISTDERTILTQFWDVLQATDVLIGHNALNFDLPFIRQRSWILGVRPSRRIDLRRFCTQDVMDTMQIFSNWGATKFASLNDLGEALGCGQKSGEGSQVGDWWTAGNLPAIAEYCRQDVRLAYKVYQALMFLPMPERFSAWEPLTSKPIPINCSSIGGV